MNPFTCASLTFLLTVSQAVAVAAKGKKSSSSGSKSKSSHKISVPVIAGIIVAVIVVLILLAIFLYVKKRQASKSGAPHGQDAPYIIGGQPTGPEKQDYSPYPPTSPPPPQAQYNQGPGQWNQGPPPPQNQYPAPSFPSAHV